MKNIKKTPKIFRLKNIAVLCLISLFLWWGSKAVIRYWYQPLTTDISYSFGDNTIGIQFPQVTFCETAFFLKNPFMKDCGDGSWNFISEIQSCLKSGMNLTVHSLMKSLHTEISNIFEVVYIWTGSEYLNLSNMDGQVWSEVFLDGPCYTFDLSRIEKFKHVPYSERSKPGIEFVMAEKNPWKMATIYLHTRNDLPDADQLNDIPYISFSNKTQVGHEISVRKKRSKRETTRNEPCIQYEHNSCQSIKDNELILDKFKCKIPILYNGQHLDDAILQRMPNCSNDITLAALDFILDNKSKCIRTQTCENTRFTLSYRIQETWREKKNLVWIDFKNPIVEYHNTYISYDVISLVGEIGGILGLTLGASALSTLESMMQRLSWY